MQRVAVALSLLLLLFVTVARAGRHTPPSPAATVAANRSNCGSCDSLGYQCLTTQSTVRDLCGNPMDTTACPVPQCSVYCEVMFGVTEGFCSEATHQCVCDTSAGVAAEPQATSTPAAAHRCTIPLCSRLRYSKCIPARAWDSCTNTAIAADACASTLTVCNSTCPCTTLGDACRCPKTSSSGIKAQVEPEPEPEPETDTTPSPVPAKTLTMTTGGIVGIVIQASLGLFWLVALGVDFSQKPSVSAFASQSSEGFSPVTMKQAVPVRI